MKNNISKKIIGVLLVVFGVMMALSYLDIVDFSAAFRGWWTMFIIIPCLVSLIFDGFNFVNIIGLGVGCILFLSAQKIIPYGVGGKLILPFVIVVVGTEMIFAREKKKEEYGDEVKSDGKSSQTNMHAIFSTNTPCFDGQGFDGCNCCAVFGGMELRLKNADITSNCVINTCSVFGGTDVFLPSNVKVVVNSTNILGGANNKFVSSTDENAPVVFIKNTCVFGGLNIK